MATAPDLLPHEDDGVFLTDGGLETDLIFRRGIELPEFASFPLLDDAALSEVLRDYYRDYLRIGAEAGVGMVLESPTWRASSEWGELLGYNDARLADLNTRAVELLADLRAADGADGVVISGCIGPRGDAYVDLGSMTPDQAAAYHAVQVGVLADAGADLISVLTLTNTAEAIGVVRAAVEHGIASVVSFTVETDGRLPDGTALADAIAAVDDATDEAAAYFLINCAHPDHFRSVLDESAPALGRLRGVKANASRMSHVELDEAPELDDGDPAEFGLHLAALHAAHPHLNVLGGCCGTDSRHLAAVAGSLGTQA
jgi:homocysteine S-methyltransferase